MDALKQSLKIGVGLAAMVAVCIAILPERPSLFASEAAAEREPQIGDDLLLATTDDAPPAEPDTGPLELAQAAPSVVGGTGSQSGDGEPTPGQLHLQRLRERGQTAPAAAPSPAAPAPAPTAPAPQAPAPATPPSETATTGGGQGLDSLTRPAAPPQFRLFRSAQAVDSATIRADGQTIRLAGVLPVAADERCADGSACGEEAREAMGAWLSGQEVVCAVSPGAGETAPCVRGEEDIAQWAVENGWAEAEPGSVYQDAEARARGAGLGIWGSGGR